MGSSKQRLAAAASLVALGLSGCYVVPVTPDGRPVAIYPAPAAAVPAPLAPAAFVMTARLYPTNDIAAHSGVLTGTVTNHMNGRGEFQLNFAGEHLTGEATRVQGDARRGVANAYGGRGTYMNCQYQMNSPTLGSGVCTLSNGARYTLHIGS